MAVQLAGACIQVTLATPLILSDPGDALVIKLERHQVLVTSPDPTLGLPGTGSIRYTSRPGWLMRLLATGCLPAKLMDFLALVETHNAKHGDEIVGISCSRGGFDLQLGGGFAGNSARCEALLTELRNFLHELDLTASAVSIEHGR